MTKRNHMVVQRPKLRVLSAIGPGDVVSAHRDWLAGVRTVSETSITFSSQEFDFFTKHRIPHWTISTHPARTVVSDGANRIENRPRAIEATSGTVFHLSLLLYAISLLGSAIRFRATHAIIDSGTTHWFALSLFRLFGIQVHPNFHNVYWPDGHEPKRRPQRAILRLDSLFLRAGVRSALGVSPECGRQVGVMSGGKTAFFDYRAQFVRGDFGTLPRPVLSTPMRIMFAGRVELNKGVFDILIICEMLSKWQPGAFKFDICGSGNALDELRSEITRRQLGSDLVLHGKLIRPDLLKVYGDSHLVIVPTRSSFCEGLPMVCAEAMIAGRPVITSRLSNALVALDGAVVEARADDPADYAHKIALLAQDPAHYARLVKQTAVVSQQFTDPSFGLTSALEKCLLNRGNSDFAPSTKSRST